MTEEEKNQIRILRSRGYSYGKISKILGIKRSTISDYCYRYKIEPTDTKTDSTSSTEYRCCPYCHQLFLATTQKNQQFCSSQCRINYWKRENEEFKQLEQEGSYLMTLQKELDFLGEQSDEWLDDEALHLCRKEETTI